MSWTPYATRNEMIAACVPKNARIAELGVFMGDFARIILCVCNPAELHLIDTWRGSVVSGDKDGKNIITIADMGVAYEQLSQEFGRERRVFLHRDTTQRALTLFPDHYFDFVYVDADHGFASVYADLRLAAQKSKGMIGGHDFCEAFPGTMEAVTLFCSECHEGRWDMTHLTRDGCPSYILKKG